MRFGVNVLAIALGLGLAFPAPAQEMPEPAKEEPAKQAAEAPAKEAPAEAAKEAAKEAAPEAAKDLSPCAKALVPLAESYKKAYEELQKWIADVHAKTSEAGDKVRKIQEQIQQNETAITKAKLDGDDAKAKELTKANKQLWNDLETAKKGQASVCSGFPKEAAQRVKQYTEDSEAKLDECKSQMK